MNVRIIFFLSTLILMLGHGFSRKSFAQKQGQDKADSLFALLRTAKEDTCKANILNSLAYELMNNYPDSAIYFASKAQSLSQKLDFKIGVVKAKVGLGIALYNLAVFDKSLNMSNDAIGLCNQLLMMTDLGTNSEFVTAVLNLKALAHNTIANIFVDQGRYPEAMKQYLTSLKIREKVGNKKGMVGSYTNMGLIHFNQSNNPEALKNYYIALKICKEEGYIDMEARVLSNIGGVYYEQGNYPEALKIFFSSLRIQEKMRDKYGIASNYHNIGLIYEAQRNYPEALRNYYASLKINEEIGNLNSKANDLSSIGNLISSQGKYNEALRYYLEALKIQEEIGDKVGISLNYNNIGMIYNAQGNYSEALKNQFEALAIQKEIGDIGNMAFSYYNLGNIYLNQKKTEEASRHLLMALSLSKEIGSLTIISESYHNLATVDSVEGNFKQALEHYKLFITYQDSLFNKENTKKITQQQMQYEFDKKESIAKAEQEKKDAIAQEELQKQKIVRNVFIGGLLIVLIFMYLIYQNYKKQRKTNEALDASNHKLDESIKNLEKTNHVLKETQQQLVHQEKLASLGALTAGIAHEIKNPLNFVNNFAELSAELLEELETVKNEDERVELTKTIRQNLLKINEHGKRADGIVKSMLEHSRSGLAEKQETNINQLCEEYVNLAYHGKRATVPDFNCSIEKYFAPDLLLINAVPQDISRVILNLVNNAFDAMKEKSDAKLEISTEAINQPFQGVRITVRDNGAGIPEEVQQKIFEPFFTTKPTGQGTGLGLSLSFDIIKAHGGQIEVESTDGKGTEFIVTLPINSMQ
jgi:two-component system NtrC family sensor kinase